MSATAELTPLKMNPVIRDQWTAALRSGEYEQAWQALCDGEGYCCLGVLCELARLADVNVPLEYEEDEDEEISGEWRYDGNAEYLPEPVKVWAGLDDCDPLVWTGRRRRQPLAFLNDTEGWSFAQIADAIDGKQPAVSR